MAKRTCSIDGCDNAHYGRGWCGKHYQRWKRNGDPEARIVLRDEPEDVRFWVKVDQSDRDGCWRWTGSHTLNGYGQFRSGGRPVLAHRWGYELLVGPIPEGLQLDHLCRVRNCVNPDHLEPVTQQENIRRGRDARWGTPASTTKPIPTGVCQREHQRKVHP